MKRIVLGIIVIFISVSNSWAQSNEGTEFWFGFMEHIDESNTKVIMITSKVNTTGVISVPSRGFSQAFEVVANQVTVFQDLPQFIETRGSDLINDNAIKITSIDPVSVYIHQYSEFRSEASLVLPRESIGSLYYVLTYSGVPGVGFQEGFFPSEFLIVANEDNTEVEFTLSADSRMGKLSGSTHSILLNQGEVYQLQGREWIDDLSGTYIRANKDFSLFAGSVWSQVPINCTFMDNLVEQMFPVSTWGKRYVGSPFAQSSNDVYRVIASEDNTTVTVQGDFTTEILINSGEYADFESSNGVYVEADKAISVAQYMVGSSCNGGIGDPSMLILNTVEQIRDTVTLFNSRFENILSNYINVITQTGDEDLVFFDGQNMVDMGFTFQSIGDEGLFSYATVPTSNGSHTIFTSGCGIIAIAYGYGLNESYAYSGGASFTKINENPIPDGSCLDEEILFETGLPPDRFKVSWDLGDGNSTAEHEFVHKYPNLDTGSYELSLIVEDLCFDEIDTLYKTLKVSLRQDLTVGEDQEGCVGTSAILSANDLPGSIFEWSGPDEFQSSQQFPVIEDLSIEKAGIYQVVGNISGCRTFPEDLELVVHLNPEPALGEDIILCPFDGDVATLYPGEYSSYSWSDGSLSPSITVGDDGEYSIEVTDENGCIGRDSIRLFQQCPTRIYIPNAFSPNWDGVNDHFVISGIEILSYDLKVYDRWGSLLFHSDDPAVSWDGRSEFLDYVPGDYPYVLLYEGYDEDAEMISEKVVGTVLLVK